VPIPWVQAGGKRAAPGVDARRPAPAGHVRAVVDRGDERADVLRWVLQVTVHRHEDRASRPRETGVHRRVLTAVAGQADDAHAGIARMEGREQVERSVRRAVVDVDDLERPRERLERRDGAPMELLQRSGLLEQVTGTGDDLQL